MNNYLKGYRKLLRTFFQKIKKFLVVELKIVWGGISNMDLETLAKKLRKKYGGINIASEIEDGQDYISTGNKACDLALNGGIAFGFVTEWSGGSQSGKTLMLQQMLANAQQKYNCDCLWLDRENAFTNARAIELGIDINRVIVVKPEAMASIDHMTELTSMALEQIDKDKYVFIAIDSISAFEEEVAWDKKEGRYKADMGKKARSIHNLFRKVLPRMTTKTSLNFTNQRTFKVGVLFGSNETVTGGEGPKYYTTYRLRLAGMSGAPVVNKNNEVIGHWVSAVVVKTRRGPSYRKILFPFYFKTGIPYYGGYARLLADRGYLVPKNKSEFKSIKQSTLLYGEEQLNEHKIEVFLEKHPELIFDDYPEYNEEVVEEEVEDKVEEKIEEDNE